MAKDHFVPAALIGMFSMAAEGKRRRRPVAVLRREDVAARMDVPERLMCVEGLYDDAFPVMSADGVVSEGVVDRSWETFEGRLPELLGQMVRREPIDALGWLSVLVPWVASIFVRGADWAERFEQHGAWSVAGQAGRNANSARLLEMHYLLAPVSGAHWMVFHVPATASLITSDVGVIPATMRDSHGDQYPGWLIPIAPTAILGIFPVPARTVMTAAGEHWVAVMEHRDVAEDKVDEWNRMIAAGASSIIVGRDCASVERYTDAMTAEAAEFGGVPGLGVMDGWSAVVPTENRRRHQYDWHRLVSLASLAPVPGAKLPLDGIDPEAIAASGWKAPVFFTINHEWRWSGLDIADVDPLAIRLDLLVGNETSRAHWWWRICGRPGLPNQAKVRKMVKGYREFHLGPSPSLTS